MKKERCLREVDDQNDNIFSLIANFDGNGDQVFDIKISETLSVLPLRSMVLFPGVFMLVPVGRKSSLRLVREADRKKSYIAVVYQEIAEADEPVFEDLHPTGVAGKIVRVLKMPNQTTTVIIQGMKRLELKNITETHPYLKEEVNIIDEETLSKNGKEFQTLVGACKDLTIRYIKLSDSLHQESTFAIKNLTSHMFLIDFICVNPPLEKDGKMELLHIDSLRERTYRLLEILNREVQLAEIKAPIQICACEDIDQQQCEYFLQQQIKTAQDELGGGDQGQEIEEMRQKAEHMRWSPEVHETFLRELAKLEHTHPQPLDYSIQLNYLRTVLNLPWGVYTTGNPGLKNVKKTLNKDHYGLEKVGERAPEHSAILKLKGDMKSPIIHLYGPLGVGKTSLGKSIAVALRRKYIRMPLGSVHDEAEVRGHRKTYIGAILGRITKNPTKTGSSNPVSILDGIGKVGADRQGGPSSALFKVLDPGQNMAFYDNFLDVDYNLSKMILITTANNLNTIPGPLFDRVELIEVSGYITEEKVEIVRKRLVPKELKANGTKETDIKIPEDILEAITESYARESDVHELERKIGKILHKSACQYAMDGFFSKTEIKPTDLYDFLGILEYTYDKYQGSDHAGAVTGSAWTAVGGEILFIKASLGCSKGDRLTLAGSLDEVMKESAMLMLEYIKAHTPLLNLDEETFDNWNIHIHVPEGAIPRDGPLADITMATSSTSTLTQRKVEANLAVTDEIILRGKVLLVGGIKEGVLVAKRTGIKEIIMSAENRKSIDEIQDIYLKRLTFHYVSDVKEVFAIVLTREKVADAIGLSVEKANQE